MNNLLNELKKKSSYKETENGALAYDTTMRKVYDLFAFGGAYRQRSKTDTILLFKEAFEEDQTLALKCLFYLRDCRGGQGERKFFRTCYNWLCNNYPEIAKRNLDKISEYGRWDDLIYSAIGTQLEDYMLFLIKEQLILDMQSTTPSLLGKWLPSENASAYTTKKTGNKIRKYMKFSHKEYRKILSNLRTKINIVEKLMSENRWNEIEFDKIPSKAGLIYKNAFARRDIIAKKYETFAKDKETTVNADTLYPYDVVDKAIRCRRNDTIDRQVIEKYWNNLPNYCGDKECNMLCVVDTSGSMTCGSGPAKPINVAIALGIYCGERAKGPFQNHFITFASRPNFIEIRGIDFVDKVERIYDQNLIDNTDLIAVFDLLKDTVKSGKATAADLPETLIVISDMEIDCATTNIWTSYLDRANNTWTQDNIETEMEKIRKDWENEGLKLPNLVYWNVEARNNTILDLGENVSLVSGCSPILLEQIMTGVKGWDLCLAKLLSNRYEQIK